MKKLTNRRHETPHFESDSDEDVIPVKEEFQEDLVSVPVSRMVRFDPLESSASNEVQPSGSTNFNGDLDYDKHFLLSLYRDFKKISEELKLDAKGEIIDVLRKYTIMSRARSDYYLVCE